MCNNCICDRICKNVHSSHMQFFIFEDSQNLLSMIDTLDTFRVYRATISLSFLQILDLYTVSSGFYESLNEENRMCELCTFSKSGHTYACKDVHMHVYVYA